MRTLPAQMTAVGMSALGAAEVLILEQRAVPTPNQNELLIKVATAGINRGDIVQRRGSYPPPPGPAIFSASRSPVRLSRQAKLQEDSRSATKSCRS